MAFIEKNKFVEWVSEDNNYHCKYTFRPINNNVTELEYYEWVDEGTINDPFTQKTLEKLKFALESL